MEKRLSKIRSALALSAGGLVPLAGDASQRRFFRVTGPADGPSAVLVVFPEGTGDEEVIRYTGTGHLLREAGLPVPGIYRRTRGALLVEDCGDELLQEAVRTRAPFPLYREAADLIGEMQNRVPASAALNPPFDEEKFLRELEFFLTHTVSGFFGEKLTAAEQGEWRKSFSVLAREPLSQPRGFCHRDFHSRNLLLRDGQLRIIDFQDGRAGPWTYDLVSLLEDPYVSLPPGLPEEMKARFLAGRRGVDFSGDFRRGYDMMALQRLLKAAGTFGFQAEKMGKHHYAAYLPAALGRAAAITSAYPEFESLGEQLAKYLRRLPRA
ncbi:MAG: phosphotransferase [Candidatus Erginobacter occultus]|nr:phosphotransferase [Candidatus Erginobacter occultus]